MNEKETYSKVDMFADTLRQVVLIAGDSVAS